MMKMSRISLVVLASARSNITNPKINTATMTTAAMMILIIGPRVLAVVAAGGGNWGAACVSSSMGVGEGFSGIIHNIITYGFWN